MADGQNISAAPDEDKALLGNITPKQLELLRFIRSFIERNGYAPSFDEMKDHLRLNSKSGIARLVDCLTDRGYLAKQGHVRRGIDITAKGFKMTDQGGKHAGQ